MADIPDESNEMQNTRNTHGGPVNDDIVQRITNFIFSGDYVCLCDHCVLLDDAKDEIERLQKLVRSLRLDLITCHGELMGAYDEEARRD